MKKFYSNPISEERICEMNFEKEYEAIFESHSFLETITVFESEGKFYHAEMLCDKVLEVVCENGEYRVVG